ncbi:DUF3349 domain-containing protein [Allobranchiibius sp. GilTou38]|nr:DUF3349 domain-containing protein [Allobranchiibius sp. GilTou38]
MQLPRRKGAAGGPVVRPRRRGAGRVTPTRGPDAGERSDEEVKNVARQLISGAREHGDDAAVSRVDVGVLVTEYTDGVPSESDLRRVQERSEKKGWPLHDAR